MASVDTHAVVQRMFPLFLLLVSRIRKPSVALQQNCGAEILLAVPPVAWARGRAARAQNAFIKPIQLPALFLRLQVFLAVGCGGGVLQVWFDGFVLFVEMCEVGHHILHDVGMWEWVDLCFFLSICGDSAYIPVKIISISASVSDRYHEDTVDWKDMEG
jgi:hypothetical protein